MPDRVSHSRPVEPLGIGERLRNAREAKGLSLTAVAGMTHIRSVYLQALEDEQFDRLPGSIYVKGFLRTYAAALGIDPDDLLEAYPVAFESPAQPIVGVHSVEVPIRPTARPSRVRRIISYAALVVLLVLIFLGVIGYRQARQFSQPPPPPTAVVPSPARPPAGAPFAEVPDEPAPVEPRQPTEPPAAPAEPVPESPVPGGNVSAVVTASDTSWVRVTADGRRIFQGLLRRGEVRTWAAAERLTIRIGNTPAVDLVVNGRRVRPPAQQRVWEQTFTAP